MIVAGNGSPRIKWQIQTRMANTNQSQHYTDMMNIDAMYSKNKSAVKETDTNGLIVCDKTVCGNDDIVVEK